MNEKGERFADACALNNMVIGGSVFPHKRIRKATWVSPDLITARLGECVSASLTQVSHLSQG